MHGLNTKRIDLCFPERKNFLHKLKRKYRRVISLPLPPAPDLNLSPYSPFLSSVRKCARNGKTSTFGSFFASRMKEKKGVWRENEGRAGQSRAAARSQFSLLPPLVSFASLKWLHSPRWSPRGNGGDATDDPKGGRKKKPFMFFFPNVSEGDFQEIFSFPSFFRNISTLFSRRSRFLSCAANFLGKTPPSLLPSFPFLAAGKWISWQEQFWPEKSFPSFLSSFPWRWKCDLLLPLSLLFLHATSKAEIFLKKQNRITKQIWETRRPPPPLKKR